MERSNQVWQIDLTYVPMRKGFMYLVAIIDVYSRFVVNWSLTNSMDSSWLVKGLSEAINKYGKPEIVNSDQCSQFTSKEWTELLISQGIKISMDSKGRAIDNIYIERFWRTVKYDYVYLNPAEHGWEMSDGLAVFFNRYNHDKLHQGIGRRAPASLYFSNLSCQEVKNKKEVEKEKCGFMENSTSFPQTHITTTSIKF